MVSIVLPDFEITKFKNLTFQRHGMVEAFSFEEAKFSMNYKNNK